LESEISPRAREVSFLVLALLLSANLLNYIDRQVLYAVFPLIKGDFRLSDTALGFLGSAFMISYMVAAPFFGWKGAVTSRTKLASWGLLTWSLSTVRTLLASPLENFIAGMFSAEFFLFLSTGPLNAVIANVTTPMTRTMAFAANIFLIHALGDAVSPTAIGWFSDLWGLKTALLTTAFAVALAAGLSFLCTRFVSEDILRAEENTRYE
jgi:MFS family permease